MNILLLLYLLSKKSLSLTASKDLFNVDKQFLRRIFPENDEKEEYRH